ncbi:unnamed protein product [Polarella glacialis]|uniref:Uncharacterized protein n=1 Tax=Polarella glacialis TaxID=89957 RepID=A0A813GCT9_POLGL|nr:unnamed protein product [Polarella glacialis]
MKLNSTVLGGDLSLLLLLSPLFVLVVLVVIFVEVVFVVVVVVVVVVMVVVVDVVVVVGKEQHSTTIINHTYQLLLNPNRIKHTTKQHARTHTQTTNNLTTATPTHMNIILASRTQ